ncbi:unnamed protein product [Pedinophyceae sp. YPF-701]|nr:unnamed protein product [Pedinophyceae sp. YPF-701]
MDMCWNVCDLTETSQLCCTVYTSGGEGVSEVLGSSTIPLFGKKGGLKTGRRAVGLHWGVAADPGCPTGTPHKPEARGGGVEQPADGPVESWGTLGGRKLVQALKRLSMDEHPDLPWLNNASMDAVSPALASALWPWGFPRGEDRETSPLAPFLDPQGAVWVLCLELPTFAAPVVYHHGYIAPPRLMGATGRLAPASTAAAAAQSGLGVPLITDPELELPNLAEAKHRKLIKLRSAQDPAAARSAKPDVAEKLALQEILCKPCTQQPGEEDRELLWRFRYRLLESPGALTKFMRCVDWSDQSEVKEALTLLSQWAAIGAADALELLTSDFWHRALRRHAVDALKRAPNAELEIYLPQLVQALRWEQEFAEGRLPESYLAKFLISRAKKSFVITNSLHWYLTTEEEDPDKGTAYKAVHRRFMEELGSAGPEGVDMVKQLVNQKMLLTTLEGIAREVSKARGRQRLALLQDLLAESVAVELKSAPVPLPLDPTCVVNGLVLEDCFVFKSAMCPIKLTFRVQQDSGHADQRCDSQGAAEQAPEPPATRSVIFKVGDDMRQDQLVMQMFALMDTLLRRENLDLNLTVYRVLATSRATGMVEFVPSLTIEDIIKKEYKTVLRFLAAQFPDVRSPSGVRPSALTGFIKSCAGYCVMTYLLGVGDRHPENLLLTPEGYLFHIDFAYILGRDPKPLPPPIRISPQMVEAIGGFDSEGWGRFKTYCFEAFNILRKGSNLILSLVHLMAGSSLPDVAADPQGRSAALKVQENLRLDLDDEKAMEYMSKVIRDSATAVLPQFMDSAHRWAQFLR